MDSRVPVSVLFDGSFDGFLCIIHAFYYDRIEPLHIQTEEKYQQTLDSETYYIAANEAKAKKVMEGIREKISVDAAHTLYNASLAGEGDIHMDMFKYTVMGFKMGPEIDSFLQNDSVMRVRKLARQVGSETHKLTGFCRFAETKQGIYYCFITPNNHVLAPLAEHFRDRFMNHPWIIHDKKHNLAAVYDGNEYVIAEVPKDIYVPLSDGEEQIQDLWVKFFETIAIKERSSYKRQRQVLPLYYRNIMTEFKNVESAKKAALM
jgi:probable DNA metabolism protein